MAEHSYGEAALEIVRGDDDPPIVFELTETDEDGEDVPVIFEGAVFRLRIKGSGVSFDLSSAEGDLTLDAETGAVTWPYSEAESLRFQIGKPAPFRLWREADGNTRTFVVGTITGVGVL